MRIKSRYTLLEPCDEGVLLFNTKNGVQAMIDANDPSFAEDLKILRENGDCEQIQHQAIKELFCVEDDVDEAAVVMASYYKKMFDPTDLAFIIMPNNSCNCRCLYCYQDHDSKRMSDETVENFLHAIKAYHQTTGIKHFYAEWFGGEPLVTYDLLVRITDSLSAFFEENGIDYHFGATTNGTLLTDDRIDYLLNHHFDFFQITVDGDRETHNRTRPLANGDDCWETICNNLIAMHNRTNAKFRVSLRVNYNTDTFAGIPELFSFIRENLDDRFGIFFHSIGKWGGKNDDCFEVVDASVEPVTTLLLMDEAIEYGIQPETNYDFFSPFQRVCYAGLPYHFTIGTDGKLRKCNEEDEKCDRFNIVGTVENGVIELDINRWSRFVLPAGCASLPKRCEACVYLPICFAQGCPKSRIQNDENTCPRDFTVMPEVLLNKYRFWKKKRAQQHEGGIKQ